MRKPEPLPPISEPRCPKCGTLLFRARLPPGVWIEIICKRCTGKKTPIVIERKAA